MLRVALILRCKKVFFTEHVFSVDVVSFTVKANHTTSLARKFMLYIVSIANRPSYWVRIHEICTESTVNIWIYICKRRQISGERMVGQSV